MLWTLIWHVTVDGGYSLDPPVPTINALSKHIKNINIFPMKFSIFTAETNLCILHGQVFLIINHQWMQIRKANNAEWDKTVIL